MTQETDRMLQFFEYEHLPRNAERTTALRKLLEAKDCAVRAVLYKEPAPAPAPTASEPTP